MRAVFVRFRVLGIVFAFFFVLAACSQSPNGETQEIPDTRIQFGIGPSNLTSAYTCGYDSGGNISANSPSPGGQLPTFSWEKPETETSPLVQTYAIIVDSNAYHSSLVDNQAGCSPDGEPWFRCTHLVLYNIPADQTTTQGMIINTGDVASPVPEPTFGWTYSRYDGNQVRDGRTERQWDGPCPDNSSLQNPNHFIAPQKTGDLITYTAEIFAMRTSMLGPLQNGSPEYDPPDLFKQRPYTRSSFRDSFGSLILESRTVNFYYRIP